jgi:hypothetical protein
MRKLLPTFSMVLSLITSAGTVQAGFLGHSLAEYQNQYTDASTSRTNPNMTLFRRDGLETGVIFYMDRAVLVEITKSSGEPFSDSELRGILKSNPEGSPWFLEKGVWINGHSFAHSIAMASADKTSLMIINLKEEMQRQLSKTGSH